MLNFLFLFTILMLMTISMYKIFTLSSMILIFQFFNETFTMEFLIFLDFMSYIFVFSVSLISALICIYSFYYMQMDTQFYRFSILVFLFVLSMIFMIISPSLFSILLGWDMLGITSYCLVVYYQNNKSNNSGMITILSNRLGDAFMMFSLCWAMSNMNFSSFSTLFINPMNMLYLMMFLFIGTATKSAQIPFSSWLPAAMAAPTPVSSLVHSSTLVTAGVYLMIRFSMMFKKFLMLMIFYTSLMTMILSSLSGVSELDLKKVVAFSTLSQLGFMLMINMFSMPMLCFFHLVMHAFFKSLMFLCAGILIHSFNTQNLKNFGIMINYSLVSTIFFLVSLSMSGFLFFSGFFSKDLMVEFFMNSKMNFFLFILLIMSITLTIFYSFRLIMKSLINNLQKPFTEFFLKSIFFPLIILSMMSLLSGNIFMWKFISWSLLFSMKKFMIFMIIITSIISSFMFLSLSPKLSYLLSIWFLNNFISSTIFSMKVNLLMDKKWFEILGSKKMYNMMSFSSMQLINWENKSTKTFLFFSLMWALLIMYKY